jgi:NitT/TauT family transport system substrate-binding protein
MADPAQSIDQNGVPTQASIPETVPAAQAITPTPAQSVPPKAPSMPQAPAETQNQNTKKKSFPISKLLMGLIFLLMILILAAFWVSKKNENNSGGTLNKGSATVSAPLKPITVQLSWFNTAEFSGFYLAQDKGFYKDAGLDVKLAEVKLPRQVQDIVASGEADFGVAGIDGVLLARESGSPMKAIAAIYQQSPVAFITLKKSGINKPQDFVGKRVTIECGSNAEYPQRALLKKLQLTDKISENCSTYSIDQLLSNKTDVFAGFVTNESILLDLQNHPVTNILVVDYGINYYPNLLFTSEKMITNDRATVRKFVTATLKGYEYALAHPDEAVSATMNRKSGLGKLLLKHQQKTMEVQSPLIFTGKTPLGWMENTIWEQGKQILLEQKIIKGGYDIKSVYTNEFIKLK